MALKVSYRPCGDRLVVKPFELREPDSRIILPDTAKYRPMQGEVLAVGPGLRREDGTYRALDRKPGEVVAYAVHSGIQLHVNGEKLLLLEEKEVLAVIDGIEGAARE